MERAVGRRIYHRARGQKAVLGEREKRRLAQLAACLVLFAAVLFSRGGDRLGALYGPLRSAVRADANFRTALTDLGWAVAERRPPMEALTELWSDVFLPRGDTLNTGGGGRLYRRIKQSLGRAEAVGGFLMSNGRTGPDPMAGSFARTILEVPQPEAEPAVVYMNYTGPALPENTSMDKYALCLAETMDPVTAVESSGYGWREHPINGKELFHYGVDLVVDTGTPVLAFAAGKVDYIGESDIYGQYLQLDHGDGVKSFYAHCSKLCVRQGQLVAMGDKVAESGATGDVTGPHLHFEIKRQGVWLNPNYYISTLA